MTWEIKKVEYHNITVDGAAGEGAKLLSQVAGFGVNLLAYKAIQLEPSLSTRFSLFPDDSSKMSNGAKKAGLDIDGPYSALFIKGDEDESGALADIYERLSRAGIFVRESSGIANIKESYGVILYLNQDDCDKAVAVLQG